MNRFLKKACFLLPLALLLTAAGGCMKDKSIENAHVPRLMIEKRGVNYGALSGIDLTLPVSRTSIRVEKEPLINEFEILNVELVKVDLGMALLFQLSEKGSRILYRASVSENGSRIVLAVNGNAVGARRIDGALESGAFYTFVELPDDQLGQFVLEMKATLQELQTRKASGW